MSKATTKLTQLVRVRQGYTEQDDWRKALGNSEPLHVFTNWFGCIDAPEYIPIGCSRGYEIQGKKYTEEKMTMR